MVGVLVVAQTFELLPLRKSDRSKRKSYCLSVGMEKVWASGFRVRSQRQIWAALAAGTICILSEACALQQHPNAEHQYSAARADVKPFAVNPRFRT